MTRQPYVDPPISVHNYRGLTQADASVEYRAQAARLATRGYFPVSQSWEPGPTSAVRPAFIVAGVLCLLLGLFVLWPLLIVGVLALLMAAITGGRKPGTLTVTYHRQ
jgi:hypothetical protein